MPGKHVRFNEENILYSPAPSDSTPSPTISESSLPSSTGPNTPPQLFMRLGPVNIHPLLAYHSYVSPINYNVSYPPNTASANIRASPVNLAAYSTWDDLQLCSPATSSQGNPSLGPTMMHPTLNSMQLMSAALVGHIESYLSHS
ncbi:hypothetical protein BDR03DRAFT_643259 [Suillus americanus]|nr:hypothetical protein BDR03DRAFT_643259 [Suillus americanus]